MKVLFACHNDYRVKQYMFIYNIEKKKRKKKNRERERREKGTRTYMYDDGCMLDECYVIVVCCNVCNCMKQK